MTLKQNDRNYINNLIGPDDALLFQGWITKTKRNKTDKRILVVSKYRIFSIKRSLTSREVKRHSAVTELLEVSSESNDHVFLRFPEFFINATTDSAEAIFKAVYSAYCPISIGWPDNYACKFVCRPSGRIALPVKPSPGLGQGFLETYKAACYKYDVPIDHRFLLYWQDRLERGSAEMDLSFSPGIDFALPKSERIDIRPISFALRYNTHFRGLKLENISRKDAFSAFSLFLNGNETIQELILSNIGASKGIEFLGNALDLAGPANSQIRTLNLSYNPLKLKGAEGISKGIKRLRHLENLFLSRCGFPASGIVAIIDAFRTSQYVSQTLISLDLSFNKFGAPGSKELSAWFSDLRNDGSNMEGLNLECTNIIVTQVFENISKACPKLSQVNISGNKLDKTDLHTLRGFASTCSLTELHLEKCKCRGGALVQLAHELLHNSSATGVLLNMSYINFGVKGIKNFISSLTGANTLKHLFLNGANLQSQGLTLIAKCASSLPQLETLSISGNVQRKRAGDTAKALATLIVGHSGIKKFRIAGDKNHFFGPSIGPILQACAHSKSMQELDISGNHMTDAAVSDFAELLKRSTTLETLYWDNNDLSLDAFQSIRDSMKRNSSIHTMPKPEKTIAKIRADTPKADRERVLSRLEDLFTDIQAVVKTHGKGKTIGGDAGSDSGSGGARVRPLTMAPRTLSTYGQFQALPSKRNASSSRKSRVDSEIASTPEPSAPPPRPRTQKPMAKSTYSNTASTSYTTPAPPSYPAASTASTNRLSAVSEAIMSGDSSFADDLLGAVEYEEDDEGFGGKYASGASQPADEWAADEYYEDEYYEDAEGYEEGEYEDYDANAEWAGDEGYYEEEGGEFYEEEEYYE